MYFQQKYEEHNNTVETLVKQEEDEENPVSFFFLHGDTRLTLSKYTFHSSYLDSCQVASTSRNPFDGARFPSLKGR